MQTFLKKGIYIFFVGILLVSCLSIIPFAGSDAGTSKTSEDTLIKYVSGNQNLYRDSSGSFNAVFYPDEVNYLKDGKYLPYNLTLTSSNYLDYKNQLDANSGAGFKIYFKNNSNLDSAVRFEKDGYFFAYDLSGGVMQWAEQPGKPGVVNTLGSGAPSNSQDSKVEVTKSEFNYPGAYYNTTVKYQVLKNELKETFILGGLPSLKDYKYVLIINVIYPVELKMILKLLE
jgi:hypothetical protein